MVWAWVPKSASSLPTCLWKTSKSRPLALPHTPHLWLRYIDNTFVIQEAEHSQLLQHINTQEPHIVYHGGTGPRGNPTIPGHSGFSRSQQGPPGPSRSQQHPHYFSLQKAHTYKSISALGQQPHITAKHSVFNTLAHRAKVVSTKQQSLHKELEHIRKALQACSFPPWALSHLQHKFSCKHNINNGQISTVNQLNNSNNSGTNISNNNNKNISIVVPYIQGLGERCKRTCNKGIQVNFKGTNTMKTLLMAPKDRDNKLQRAE